MTSHGEEMSSSDSLRDISDGKKPKFSLDDVVNSNKLSIGSFLIGLILIGLGIFVYKQGFFQNSDKVEILQTTSGEGVVKKETVAEISGAVEKPGVYKLYEGARVEDLLIAAGGISADADRDWVEKHINRAAKLNDGQKLYILRVGEQSELSSAKNNGGSKVYQGVLGVTEGGLININTATLQELDSLPGIGQVYGQSIIEHRPYSDVSELLSKGVLKEGVYDKVKDLVTAY